MIAAQNRLNKKGTIIFDGKVAEKILNAKDEIRKLDNSIEYYELFL